jgi:hypothetical protein
MMSTTSQRSIIVEFPVEIVAKIFSDMDVETAWSARSVCRYWHDVFELVSYGSKESPLTGIKVGVDAVCGLTSSKGEILDQHVVNGELTFDNRKSHIVNKKHEARWERHQKKYEYWPGGRWRRYSIAETITDVKLQITGLPQRRQSVDLSLGPQVNIREPMSRRNTVTEIPERPPSNHKFQDFTLHFDTTEEATYHGNTAIKHCITGFEAPKWQIYALLVHDAKTHREKTERLQRQYMRSYSNTHKMPAPAKSGDPRVRHICAGMSGVSFLPPIWSFGTIEC